MCSAGPGEDPAPEQICMPCSPWKDQSWSSLWRAVFHERDTTVEKEKSVRKDKRRQNVENSSPCAFSISSPWSLNNSKGVKLSLGRSGSGRKVVLVLSLFLLILLYFYLTVNRSFLSRVCFARDSGWWFPGLYLNPQNFSHLIFFSLLLRRGSENVA